MEAMGLVIIVLLVVTGIVLLVTLGGDENDNKQAGYNQKLVESMVSSLPDTKIECDGERVKDQMRKCFLDSAKCSCLEQEMGELLENSLALWGYNYIFEISGLSGNQILIENPGSSTNDGPCADKPRAVASEQPVPIMSGAQQPALIRLKLCYD